jgi:uncharacterized protein (TIGR00369 family)
MPPDVSREQRMPTRGANPQITPALSVERLADTFPGDLGVELTEITNERVVGRMRIDRRHLHPGGFAHAGAWVGFADTVAAWGTIRNLPADGGFTTIELKVNVLASASEGDVLEAIGEPLHVGSRTQVWQVKVFRAERLVANFSCTQMVL